MFFKRRIGFIVLAICLSLFSGCAAIDRFIDQSPTAIMTVSPSSGAITGTQITLSAEKSSDPQGYALQYTWTLTVPSSSISALNVTDAVTVTFKPDIGGTYSVDLQITAISSSKKSTQASKAISVTTAAVTQAAATPAFSPEGATYATDQSVTLSSTTANSTIYYTTDGVTTPTTASTLYTGVISVAGNGTTKTIKAIATATGHTTSAVGSATYTINYPVSVQAATPTFNPAAGTFTSDQSVTISCTTSGASIYYTTDGSVPTSASTKFTTAIAVAGNDTNLTIKAIATATGYAASGVATAIYTIAYPAAATPTFNPAAGTFTSDQSVTISCTTSGASIYYTTDGSVPTSASTKFTTAITVTVNPNTTVKAIATAPLFSQSAVGIATYSLPTLLTMLPVAGGSFNNGTSTVTLSSFRMSATEVTQAQYATVTGNSPSYFTGDTSRPVEMVTWFDAVEFCNKLSIREGLTPVYSISGKSPPTGYPITDALATVDMAKNGYRLPTEAEWEYAARGGASTQSYTYAGSNTIDEVAWYSSNAGSTTHPVGGKTANELGIYDMSGNVWEWCWDWYGSYPSGAQTDPIGDVVWGLGRVLRGGCWNNFASNCPVSERGGGQPRPGAANYGFRIVRRP